VVFQRGRQRIFPGGLIAVKFNFTNWKLREKHFPAKNSIAKAPSVPSSDDHASSDNSYADYKYIARRRRQKVRNQGGGATAQLLKPKFSKINVVVTCNRLQSFFPSRKSAVCDLVGRILPTSFTYLLQLQ